MLCDRRYIREDFTSRHEEQIRQLAEKWPDKSDPSGAGMLRDLIKASVLPTVGEAISAGFSDYDIAREIYHVCKAAGYPIEPVYAMRLTAQCRARMAAGRPPGDEFDSEMTGTFSSAQSSLRRRLAAVSGLSGDTAFKFGIPAIDELTGGVQPGEMFAVSGAQGSMKTSFLLNGIENALERGMKVLFFSLDMTPGEIQERRLQRRLRCHQYVLHGLIRERHREVDMAVREINELDDGHFEIYGNDGAKDDLTVTDVCQTAMQVMPNVLCIDYLTLLRRHNTVPPQSDLDCVNEAMPKLKKLAQNFGLRMVVLSQMGRSSKREQFSGITGGHAKGGGIVEELAYCEIELFKDAAEGSAPPPIIATVTKSRRSQSYRSYQLEYEPVWMTFTGGAVRVERIGRGAPKRAFGEPRMISADEPQPVLPYKDGD